MSLTTSLITNPAEARPLALLHTLAFRPSQFYLAFYADVTDADLHWWMTARFTKSILDPYVRVVKAELNGEMVGFAVWERPKSERDGSEGETESKTASQVEARTYPTGVVKEEILREWDDRSRAYEDALDPTSFCMGARSARRSRNVV